MEIRPFVPDDARRIKTEEIDDWFDALVRFGDFSEWEGSAFTVVNDNDEPVAFSGLALREDGTAIGWFIGSREIRARPMFLHRTMKKIISYLLERKEIKKLQVSVVKGNRAAADWVERLGFKYEDANEEYALYSLAGSNA